MKKYSTHTGSDHSPPDAQKNSDITKAEIEAKLTGEIDSHSHIGGVIIQGRDGINGEDGLMGPPGVSGIDNRIWKTFLLMGA